jgi:Zn-dependent protease with chaperone function
LYYPCFHGRHFRSVVAVALLVGFYVLAISIAAVLVYIPYAEWTYGHRIHFKVAFACIAGAVVILWSIIPRIDRFVPPGPELRPERHPELFRAVREVAERAKQEPPASVYLVPEMNAWVAQRGGMMGFGSSRVMGIGMPLLQVTTVSQFKAVLAHEFGHYDGGDTSLGPWVYKTRETIGRTLENLGEGAWLQKPFIWYGNLFLRITRAISRSQEFNADRLSARIYGRTAAIGGLKAVYGHSDSFRRYWHHEVAPVLNSGRRPPLADGFRHFLASPLTAAAYRSSLEEDLQGREESPYDTHPGLASRIEALKALPEKPAPPNDPGALSLLRDVAALEPEMLAHMASDGKADDLRPIDWNAVGSDVYLPHWTKQAEKHSAVMQTMSAGAVAGAAADLLSFSGKLGLGGEAETDEDRKWRASGLLGSALTVALHRQGWAMRAMPGEDVLLEKNGLSLEPFAAVRKLADGTMKQEEWHALCAKAEIAEMPLGTG